MTDLVPLSSFPKPPAINRPRQLGDLTAGVGTGYPVLTYRGKVWRVVSQGNEEILRDERGPVPSIQVVILDGATQLSRQWYAKKFADGDDGAPDCWSIDGVKPDVGAPNKQSATCAGCPKAVWGSEVGDDGKERQACAVYRRLAVCAAGDITNGLPTVNPLLLRVSRSAIADLAAYARRLASVGYDYSMVVTRVGFDEQAAYPKLTFSAVGPLELEQMQQVAVAQGDSIIDRMLREATTAKGDAADESVSTTVEQVFEKPPVQAKAEPVKAKAKPAPKPEPVQEEEETPLPDVSAHPVANGTANVAKLQDVMSRFKSGF